MTLFKIIITLITLFLLYYSCGLHISQILKLEKINMSEKIIIGFFTYYFLHFIVCIPFKIKLAPLHYVTIIWSIAALALLVSAAIINIRNRTILNDLLVIKKYALEHKIVFTCLILLVLSQVTISNLSDLSIARWDRGYYVGDISSSVYTDTISQYDTYTGEKLLMLNTEYLLETYQNHEASVCQITGLSAMEQQCTVMTTVVVILFMLIMIQMGNTFWKDAKSTALFCFFVQIIHFLTFNISVESSYLYLRAFEGKGILILLILPCCFLYFIQGALDKDRKREAFLKTMIIAISSFCINMSVIYMIPFLLGPCMVGRCICERSLKPFKHLVIEMLPLVIVMAAYIVTSRFIFIYT